jgi:hypothetical protein
VFVLIVEVAVLSVQKKKPNVQLAEWANILKASVKKNSFYSKNKVLNR